jgi:aryl-alcohol dehydrogenase-like predicted oxidoreductase
MRHRCIGSLEVSVVGLGCNNFGSRLDEGRSKTVVRAALDAGITFFDTADTYGGTDSERFLGRALGADRDRIVLATKFGMPVDHERRGASPAYVARALHDSLERLGTDHVDLYQLHQPDPDTPIADTLAALDEQRRLGRVREIGCSNFSVAQLREAAAAVRDGAAAFVSVQNHYSLLHRAPEARVLPYCEESEMAFIPFFPLEMGVLSGKYRDQAPPPGTRLASIAPERARNLLTAANVATVERLRAFAEERGHTVGELAIAWLAAKPAVASVIAGATTPEQVAANVAADDWELDAPDVRLVDDLAPPDRHPAP